MASSEPLESLLSPPSVGITNLRDGFRVSINRSTYSIDRLKYRRPRVFHAVRTYRSMDLARRNFNTVQR